jgi:ABC-2 type transport system ATP-binding protein
VLGYDPARAPLQVKRRVGYLPDSVGFYDNLTAVENLSYTKKLMGLSWADRARRVSEALALVRLLDVADERVATFSRGMRQRLGLAEVIVKQAEIAILDEPTSAPQATLEFLGLIGELKAEGVTVLLSSHMLDQVLRVCNRVALFQAGHIVLMGRSPISPVKCWAQASCLKWRPMAPALPGGSRLYPGVTNVETLTEDRFRMTADRDVRPDAARAVVAALRRLSVDEPSLEAIYSRYFQSQNQPSRGARHAA